MVTHKLPFDGANYNETLYRIVTDEAPPPVSPLEELPEELVRILRVAMHKDPEERFQTAIDMLDALKGLEAWPQRAAAFDELAQSLRVRDVEAPIATTQLSPESPVARPRQREGARPPDFVETVADGASLQPRDSITRAGAPWLLGVAVAVSFAALVFFVVWLRDSPVNPGATPATPERAPASAREVAIHVVGAPPGASVNYDGAEISGNPFRVEPTNTVMQIRVEHPGYEPFVATVVPIRDTTVRVSMRPAAAPQPASVLSVAPPPTEKPPPRTGPSSRPPHKPLKPGEVRESGRGTFYTEKFE
ncbi:MAG TPA: PEGA domain-containing protein, partial [Polyangiaceae bacterium]